MSDQEEEVHDEDDFEEDEALVENAEDDYDDMEEEEDDGEEWIEIRGADYGELERRSKKLKFLEEAGVENWEGFDNAMEDMANFEEDVDE